MSVEVGTPAPNAPLAAVLPFAVLAYLIAISLATVEVETLVPGVSLAPCLMGKPGLLSKAVEEVTLTVHTITDLLRMNESVRVGNYAPCSCHNL